MTHPYDTPPPWPAAEDIAASEWDEFVRDSLTIRRRGLGSASLSGAQRSLVSLIGSTFSYGPVRAMNKTTGKVRKALITTEAVLPNIAPHRN